MKRKILSVSATLLILFALLVSPAGAQRIGPRNHCSTVRVDREPGLSTYEVNATGTGRYGRFVRYPVSNPPEVVAGPHDFGLGATSYQFVHVVASGVLQYQFQTSHNGYSWSSTGCVTTPPPLSVTIESYQAVAEGAGIRLSWSTVTEIDNADFVIRRSVTPTDPGSAIGFVPSASPGGTGGASYDFLDTPLLPNMTYWYTVNAVDASGDQTTAFQVSASTVTTF